LAVTAAQGCLFGNELSPSAGHEGLKAAYGVFQQEAHEHAPDYVPKTVTIDGWDATRWVWEHLFPQIVWILCFLHEVIKIRDWCRSKPDLRYGLTEDLWNIYHAETKRQFSQRLRRFLEWVDIRPLPNAIKQRLLRLRTKSPFFQRAYDFPEAYRTSNQVDRPMNHLDRTLFAMQGFMVIGHRRNARCGPWRCCLIFTPLVARQGGSRTAVSLLLNNSMAFAIMTTGYAICSLPLPSMAGGLSLNQLTQIELEPGLILE
jgi:hypothetical protein